MGLLEEITGGLSGPHVEGYREKSKNAGRDARSGRHRMHRSWERRQRPGWKLRVYFHLQESEEMSLRVVYGENDRIGVVRRWGDNSDHGLFQWSHLSGAGQPECWSHSETDRIGPQAILISKQSLLWRTVQPGASSLWSCEDAWNPPQVKNLRDDPACVAFWWAWHGRFLWLSGHLYPKDYGYFSDEKHFTLPFTACWWP